MQTRKDGKLENRPVEVLDSGNARINPAKEDGNLASIKTAVEILDNIVSGNEAQVDVVAPLPTGTNSIGQVTANQGGTWNINNVSGTVSLPTGASTAANQSTGNTSLSNIDTNTAPASSFDHKSISVGTTAVQVSSSSVTLKRKIIIKAGINNTGRIFVGNSDVTADTTAATDGFELSAGDSVTLFLNNANIPYVIASTASQKVFVIYE